MKDKQDTFLGEKPIRIKKISLLKAFYYYVQGHLRWKFYRFLPLYIKEQFSLRLRLVEERSPDCLAQGECVICECKTPELLLANKSCVGACYGSFWGKGYWNQYFKKITIEKWKLDILLTKKSVLEKLQKERV